MNYGPLTTDSVDIQKISAQMLGIFGALDHGIPLNKVRAFETRMNAIKKHIDTVIYDGAGHAFENPANKRGYRPMAAADAWSRTVKFFGGFNFERARSSKIAAS